MRRLIGLCGVVLLALGSIAVTGCGPSSEIEKYEGPPVDPMEAINKMNDESTKADPNLKK